MLEKLVVDCIDYTHDGKGVAKDKGIPIFIDDLLIGEKAEIEVYKSENKYKYGRVIKRLKDSKERVKPLCSL